MAVTLSDRFEEALPFAARLHATQLRKGTAIPYIAHLLAVASLVITHGGDEDEAIAALLHDAVEDQGGPPTRELIRARFGERITTIVDGCTDTENPALFESQRETGVHSIVTLVKSPAVFRYDGF
jgi:(p)ppGpp synthase/HD superfamily hydrolase